ncbi:response regulator transcription factor [Diaphorobacter sp. HDW4A]|uniref:response regulator transcription factor n=1 Tax=Diaphorobacter sp. HDW4A TaxID=2714924 RepID=UPI00140E2530|nr:response regulator transcription factor [Diaphorobacter sp. HDW4A]QIL80914.1 response regulator transcription factor [Diaphorobacter sp. HDW4A]
MAFPVPPPNAPIVSSDAALPVPVLVVEDEPLLQRRLQLVLQQLGYAPQDLVIVDSLKAAREFLSHQPVGLALVDLELPDGNGRSLITELRAEDPGLGILVVSAWSSEEAILGALRAGATGYVLKERDDLEVSLSIRSVLRGGAPIDPFIARRILELLPVTAPDSAQVPSSEVALTERECIILRHVASGLTNREIAERVILSRFTVDTHIKRIYRKLAVSSRVSAVQQAKARGFLE